MISLLAALILFIAPTHGGDYSTPGCDPASTSRPPDCYPDSGPVEYTEYYESGHQADAEARCRRDLAQDGHPGSTCHTEPAVDFEDMGSA